MPWDPDPPQGFSRGQSQVIIGRPPIPLFGGPQGIGAVSLEESLLLARFPEVGDVTFQFYKFYQIKNDQVPSLQTNQPLVIVDNLGAGVIQQASGFDIRVFDSNGVPLAYDVEFVDPGTGEFIIWINMTTVLDFEFVQLVFGKASATDGSNPNAVYDSNYQGVYHLNQTTFGADSIIDSTSKGNDGTPNGTISSVPGPIGDAIRFETLSNIDFGSGLLNNMAAVGTVSMWANIDILSGTPVAPVMWSTRGVVNIWESFLFTTGDPNELRMRYGDGSNFFEADILTSMVNVGENHFYTFTWDQPNSILRMYLDGDLLGELSVSWTLASTAGLNTVIGNLEIIGSQTSFIGFEDEARFSNIVRDPDWIKTEFNNQNDNSAFWLKTPLLTIGEEHLLVDHLGNNILVEGQ